MLLNRGNNSFGTTGGSVNFSTAPYWRFQADALNTNSYVGWTDIKFYDTLGAAITMTGQTYTEGGAGTQGANGAAGVFDGNTGTQFLRNGAPCWAQIQFSSAVKPGSFDFVCPNVLNRAAVSFRIQSSQNGSTWNDELIIWEPSYDAPTTTRTWPQSFTGGKVKAIGFEITETQGAGLGAMAEAEFHATVSGSDISNGGMAWDIGTGTAGTGTLPTALWDNSTSTSAQHLHTSLPASIYYAFPNPVSVPVEFSLTDYNTTSNGWKDFKVFTYDGTTKTYIKTVAGENWTSVPQTKTYSIP